MAVTVGGVVAQLQLQTELFTKGMERAEANTKAFAREFAREMARLNDSAKKTADGVDALGAASNRAANQSMGAFQRLNSSLDSVAAKVSSVRNLMVVELGTRAAGAVLNFGKQVLLAGENLTLMEARMKQATGSGQGFQIATESAMKLRATVSDIAPLMQKISVATTGMDIPLDEIQKMTETLYQMGQIGGQSAETISNSIVQFTQALGSGALRGEELTSVLEGLSPLADAIAKELGVTRSELKQMAEDGKITAEVMRAALTNSAAEVARKWAEVPLTITPAWRQFAETTANMLGKLANTSGLSGAMTGLFTGAREDLERIATIWGSATPTQQLEVYKRELGATTEEMKKLNEARQRVTTDPFADQDMVGIKLKQIDGRIEDLQKKATLLSQTISGMNVGTAAARMPAEKAGPTGQDDRKAREKAQADMDWELKQLGVFYDKVDDATREREAKAREAKTTAKQQAAEAERLRKQKEEEDKFFSGPSRATAQAEALLAAAKTSETAFKEVNAAIEAENQLFSKGIELSSERGQAFVQESVHAEQLQEKVEAQNRAFTESKRLKEELAETTADAEREVETQNRLAVALQTGKEAYEEMKVIIDAENEARELKLDLMGEEAKKLIALRVAGAKAERKNNDILNKDKKEEDRMKEVNRAFDHMAEGIQDTVTSATEKLLEGTLTKASDIFDEIGNIARKTVAEMLSAVFITPLTDSLKNFGKQLISGAVGGGAPGAPGGATQPGMWAGMVNASKNATAWQTAGMGGMAGAAVGSFMPAITGGSSTGSMVGGTVGGAAGALLGNMILPGVGGIIGGGLGAVGGSFFGGLFGGSDDNSGDNNAFKRWNPKMGFTRSDKPQEGGEQNMKTVDAILGEAMKAAKIIEGIGGKALGEQYFGLGVHAGSNSGIEINNKKYSSMEEAVKAAIEIVADDLFKLEGKGKKTAGRILSNTQAGSADELAAELKFGEDYDALTSGMSEAGMALKNIVDGFEDVKNKAEELGLGMEELTDAEDKAIAKFTRDAIWNLESQIQGSQESLSQIFDQFIDPIKNFQDSFKFGPNSFESSYNQLQTAQRKFDEAADAADSGDQDAMARLPALAQAVIDLGRDVYGSSGTFKGIYEDTQEKLTDVVVELEEQRDDAMAGYTMELKKSLAEQAAMQREKLDELREELSGLRKDMRNLLD